VTALIVVCLVALAVLVVVQGLVLLEMVRQTAQIRRALDLDDRPVPISLGNLAGRPVPEPARSLWPDDGDGVFVLLSTDCTTCRLVASGLRDLIDRFADKRIVTILQAHRAEDATEMAAAFGLAGDEVVFDLDRSYGEAVGVALRPAAVVVRDGILSEGATVRNASQLQQVLEELGPSRNPDLSEVPPVSALSTGGAR
jgi:hypothetical protein